LYLELTDYLRLYEGINVEIHAILLIKFRFFSYFILTFVIFNFITITFLQVSTIGSII